METWGPVRSEGKTFIAPNGTVFDITTRVRNKSTLWWFGQCRECGGGESDRGGGGFFEEAMEIHSQSDLCHRRRAERDRLTDRQDEVSPE